MQAHTLMTKFLQRTRVNFPVTRSECQHPHGTGAKESALTCYTLCAQLLFKHIALNKVLDELLSIHWVIVVNKGLREDTTIAERVRILAS